MTRPRHARKRDRKDTRAETILAAVLIGAAVGIPLGLGAAWFVGSWLLLGGNVK